MNTKAKPVGLETIIKSIQRTHNGDLLLELCSSNSKAGIAVSINEAVSDKGVSGPSKPPSTRPSKRKQQKQRPPKKVMYMFLLIKRF